MKYSYDTLTIEQYEYLDPIVVKIKTEADPLYKVELWVHILTYLTGKKSDHFETMEGSKLRDAISGIQFLLTPEICTEVYDTVTVNNQFYKGLTDISKGSFAQYYMLKTHLSKEGKLSDFLGCIYTPVNLYTKQYDMAEVSQAMKKAKCSQVLGTVFFYSRVYKRLMPAIQAYLEKVEMSLQDRDSNTLKPMDGM